MALWQFVFDLIPSSTATVNGVVAARMSREQLDSINLRFSEADATAIFEGVGKMLPEKKSWSPQLRVWGAEQTNDVQIRLLGDVIKYVQFRLNVGDLPMPLVGSICSLARELDCVLATQSGGILQPNIESIVRAIMQSDASRFVADPKRYLQEAIQRDQEQK